MHHDTLDDPIRLPALPPEPARANWPVWASIVPVLGAGVLWVVTGSTYALWFAALGPLLAVASVLDSARGRRRRRRERGRRRAADLAAAREEVGVRHARERCRRLDATPDTAGYLADARQIWRQVPERRDRLVIGRGADDADVRVEGDDAGELRRAARRIDDVPVSVPWRDGVAVVGPPALASAVARGWMLQLALNRPPETLRIDVDGGGAPEWLELLPHRRTSAPDAVCLLAGGTVPAGATPLIAVVERGTPPPARCHAVLTLTGVGRGLLDHDGATREVAVEGVSTTHAVRLAQVLAERAERGRERAHGGDASLASLEAAHPAPVSGRLAAAIGWAADGPARLDLVQDGPHAIVTGMTGSGKSELLTSWVVGLSRRHTPQDVTFLLVDFKGGRTFDHLTVLPHVVGVVTDLDDDGAVRAVESLRAELTHRERVLAAHGARDIAEAVGAELPRLVVVVDEYAALVAAHPELHELFADIAARGRALGLHLVLASQRVSGVFRDAVLANAPLRVALRVTDATESRSILGAGDAAELPGGSEGIGLALIRRAGDRGPIRTRIAHCPPTLLTGEPVSADAPVRRPWLPPLPPCVPLADLRADAPAGALVWGLADHPSRQRQTPVVLGAGGLLVVGRERSGRSTLIAALAAQAPAAHRCDADPERGWDQLRRLEQPSADELFLFDDIDLLLARLDDECRMAGIEMLDRGIREAQSVGARVVLTARRLPHALARATALIGDRLLLSLPSRAEHIAAGGEGVDPLRDAPPGRGHLAGELVQVAWVAPGAAPASSAHEVPFPTDALVGVVVPPGERAGALLARLPHGARALGDALPAAGGELRGVLWATPETWQREWRALASVRADGALVIDARCRSDYRAVSGRADVPPPILRTGADAAPRGWMLRPDQAAERVALPAITPSVAPHPHPGLRRSR